MIGAASGAPRTQPRTQPRGWVLLDVGNVLIPVDHRVVSATIQETSFPRERQTSAEREALHRFIFELDDGIVRNAEVDRGARDLAWLRGEVCGRFGVSIDERAFAKAWSRVFAGDMNAHVIASVHELRRQGLEVALCSNTNREHWSFALGQYPDLRELSEREPSFLSFEMGMNKTDAGFFEAVTRTTGAPPERHVLIDDHEPNCLAARAAGMRAILWSPSNVPELANHVLSIARSWDSAPAR